MYETLLFLHVLAAFLLGVTAVTYSAVALGATAGGPALRVADLCWAVGGLGTLILGVWLALDVDGYEVWDGWILGAIVLWVIATGTGRGRRRSWGERRRRPRAHALAADAGRDRAARADGLEAGRMTRSPRSGPTPGTCPCSCTSSPRWCWWGRWCWWRCRWPARAGRLGGGRPARLPQPALRRAAGVDRDAGQRAVAASEENLDEEAPGWVDIGFITSESTLLLLIAATVCAGVAARRAGRGAAWAAA